MDTRRKENLQAAARLLHWHALGFSVLILGAWIETTVWPPRTAAQVEADMRLNIALDMADMKMRHMQHKR